MSKKVWAFACEDHGLTRLLVACLFTFTNGGLIAAWLLGLLITHKIQLLRYRLFIFALGYIRPLTRNYLRIRRLR